MERDGLWRFASICLFWVGVMCAKERQVIAVPLIDELPRARIETPRSVFVRESRLTINGDTRRCLFMHPVSSAAYNLVIPARAKLVFGIGVSPDVWAEAGDGVEFTVRVAGGADGADDVGGTVLFTQYLNPKEFESDRRWFDAEIDLSLYEGQRITLVLAADSGPSDDPRWDSAGWSNPLVRGITW